MFRLLTTTAKFAKQPAFLRGYTPLSNTQKYSFFSKKDKTESKPAAIDQEGDKVTEEGLELIRKTIYATGAAVTATHLVSFVCAPTLGLLFAPLGGYIGVKAFYKLETYRIREYMQAENQSKLDNYVKKALTILSRFFKKSDEKQDLPTESEKKKQYRYLIAGLGMLGSFPFVNCMSLLILPPAIFFSIGYFMSKFLSDEDDIEGPTWWAFKNAGIPTYLLTGALGGVSLILTGEALFFHPYVSLMLCGFWSWILGKAIQGSYIHSQLHKKYDLLYLSLLPLEYALLGFM